MNESELQVFRDCLQLQLLIHTGMQHRDVVKLCYQAAWGAEHLLSDLSGAADYFATEYSGVSPTEEPLYEQISRDICRVNLGAWKRTGMPSEWLFRMFAGTVFRSDGTARMQAYLHTAEEVLRDSGWEMHQWDSFLQSYEDEGMPPVRHTPEYRAQEQPAYRIVGTEFVKLLPLLQKIHEAPKEHTPFVIAVDGKAGAGKSTYSRRLCTVLDAGMAYMDDFFLPPALRTPERLEEVGGNVHYERFTRQVAEHIRTAEPFSYDVFDCSGMEFHGQRTVENAVYRIVEGAYSHHPKCGHYMDFRVFANIAPEKQLRRITKRNGEAMAEVFRTRWIPMENRYFAAFHIPEQADYIIES